MNPTLVQAYRIIFGADPDPKAEDWQIAKEVISPERFDKEVLGTDLAKEVIFTIVLDPAIQFPNRKVQEEIAGEAEYQAKGVWKNLPDEVHMANIEHIWYAEELERRRETEKELTPR